MIKATRAAEMRNRDLKRRRIVLTAGELRIRITQNEAKKLIADLRKLTKPEPRPKTYKCNDCESEWKFYRKPRKCDICGGTKHTRLQEVKP